MNAYVYAAMHKIIFKGKKQKRLRRVFMLLVLLAFPSGLIADRLANAEHGPAQLISENAASDLELSGPRGLVLPAAYIPGKMLLPDLDDQSRAYKGSPAYQLLNRMVREQLRREKPTYALKLLNQDGLAKKIKNAEYDRLRVSIAQSYLAEGEIDKAYDLARSALERSGKDVALAGWVYGIAAFRLGQSIEAEKGFALAASSHQSSPWLRSAAAFWAARVNARIGSQKAAENYLEIAARYPRTFYGLIALRSLNRDADFNWNKPQLHAKSKNALEASVQIREALRLANTGRVDQSLNLLGGTSWMRDRAKREQLLAFVLEKDAPSLALHLARQTRNKHGNYYDVALYPESPWDPRKGYEVDPAIVNALIRQESRFNPKALSPTGAQGLMQLMPATATYIAKNGEVRLSDPQTNISIGQKYVRHLMMDPAVNNDLFSLAVAYNAGPGNLARWKRQLKDIDDPLLFIESIPSAETRAFVERVMVNYWIYRIRMGRDNPSLDAVVLPDDGEYVDIGDGNSVQLALEN